MEYRVEFAPRAMASAQEVRDGIAETSPERAEKWYDGLFETIETLKIWLMSGNWWFGWPGQSAACPGIRPLPSTYARGTLRFAPATQATPPVARHEPKIFPLRCPRASGSEEFGENVRLLLYGKRQFTFRILFTVQDDVIHIVAIQHNARGPAEL